jgi:hypothetical protein
MNTVEALRTYNEPAFNYQREGKDIAVQTRSSFTNIQQLKDTAGKLASVELQNSDKIINSEERNFFVKMFPDSSAQIERHVLFNRNGRLQVSSFSKGIFVDGKI